jgi:hypothetical protein
MPPRRSAPRPCARARAGSAVGTRQLRSTTGGALLEPPEELLPVLEMLPRATGPVRSRVRDFPRAHPGPRRSMRSRPAWPRLRNRADRCGSAYRARQQRPPQCVQGRWATDEDLEGACLRLCDAPEHRRVEQTTFVRRHCRQPPDRVGTDRRHLDQGRQLGDPCSDPGVALRDRSKCGGIGNHRDDDLGPTCCVPRALRLHSAELEKKPQAIATAVPHENRVPGIEQPRRDTAAHRPDADDRNSALSLPASRLQELGFR